MEKGLLLIWGMRMLLIGGCAWSWWIVQLALRAKREYEE